MVADLLFIWNFTNPVAWILMQSLGSEYINNTFEIYSLQKAISRCKLNIKKIQSLDCDLVAWILI